MSQCNEYGTQVRKGLVRYPQAPDMSESPKVVRQCFNRYQSVGSRHILNIPPPDRSKLQPKVDCWRRKPKICGEDNEVPVPDEISPTITQQNFLTALTRHHEKGFQLRDHHVRCAQASGVNPQSSTTVNRGPRSSQRSEIRPILCFPIPDYSKIPSRVDCWRRKPKNCGEDNEVPVPDDGVTTRNEQDRSPTLMSHSNEEEIVPSVITVSPLLTMGVPPKPMSRDDEANQNSDYASSESVVSMSTEAQEIGGNDKELEASKEQDQRQEQTNNKECEKRFRHTIRLTFKRVVLV
ncbi:uncharacterized protein LOC117282118 [Cryptotermes secundus]|uniref:uncharacterized protein LOC117282118 n=1 Tax=Cryptotermes secundus TaxID=105785 RepID=UPI001454DD71|nr:uncharacterized protein LOC117282118 [Cryptotermes secundus]